MKSGSQEPEARSQKCLEQLCFNKSKQYFIDKVFDRPLINMINKDSLLTPEF
jgi:hypothetical protein